MNRSYKLHQIDHAPGFWPSTLEWLDKTTRRADQGEGMDRGECYLGSTDESEVDSWVTGLQGHCFSWIIISKWRLVC